MPELSFTTLPLSAAYPLRETDRDAWILARRGERRRLDPRRPYAFMVETEPGADGAAAPVATVFLTNRECPFRCVMCDLWQSTLEEAVPDGAIAEQVRYALEQLPPARHLKLYNAGTFFDPRAIPPSEYEAVARLAAPFERVIVECHPAFVCPRLLRFQEMLRGASSHPSGTRLEVAMGLETAHPEVLERLNKRMTLESFRRAADLLRANQVALRVFILVRPPWLGEAEGVEWAKRTLEFAWECGAEVCALIPTRAGNGAMESLAAAGEFAPPSLRSLETALEFGLRARHGRVFADLWDIERFADCPQCSPARIDRLREMNRTQSVTPPVDCAACEGAS